LAEKSDVFFEEKRFFVIQMGAKKQRSYSSEKLFIREAAFRDGEKQLEKYPTARKIFKMVNAYNDLFVMEKYEKYDNII
jgi:hypothetical protein